jgi:hypothetical protein
MLFYILQRTALTKLYIFKISYNTMYLYSLLLNGFQWHILVEIYTKATGQILH